MSDLANKKCIPCEGNIPPFSTDEIHKYLKKIDGWEVLEDKIDGFHLIKNFKFDNDLSDEKENIKFTDLELIFKDLKNLFEKKGYIINWNLLKNQSLDETINALAMASPFSLEEKQILLEAKNLDLRKNKIAEILKTYSHDVYNNNTIQ